MAATTGYQLRAYDAAARAAGVELVLATDRCHVLDDPWRDGAIPVRFKGRTAAANAVRAVRAAAEQRPLDGVLAVGDGPAVIAAAVAAALGLRGHPAAAARAAANKLLTRRSLQAHGLPVPWFRALPAVDPLPPEWLAATALPCVVKPLSMAASQGVIRADTPAELSAAVERVRRLSVRTDARAARDKPVQVLVEGYIPGREVAVEGVLAGGRLQVLAIFDKPDPLDGPYFEETIYVTPPAEGRVIGPAEGGTTTTAVQRAVAALGLTDGPVHAECRVNAEGVFVLEAAARPIGGLCSRVLRFDGAAGRGVSLEALLLRHALGEDVSGWRRERRAAGVLMIPIPAAGRLSRVEGLAAARSVDGVE
ncbi:MAG: ATP-grasp domain-containing protein, partial [Acidobacteria bacterium]|nr:ATP-grasp domain-containing protein [Acidobacteriota bacterium]